MTDEIKAKVDRFEAMRLPDDGAPISSSAGLGARPITPDDVIKEADRNYDLGRKHGKEEMAEPYETLYGLVEAYLCTPNTTPAVKDAYDNLVAWFVRNKRPDGSEPLPVSPEQECS